MMFRDLCVPLTRLPFPCLELLASMATQVPWNTVCGSKCLQNQHKAPSCLLPWYQLPPMGSCTQGPLRNLSAHPIESLPRPLLARSLLVIQVPGVVLLMEASRGPACGPPKGWILEALNLWGLEELPKVEHEWDR